MSYPKHQNPTVKRRDSRGKPLFWAVAPYNFVPLPDKVVAVSESEIPTQDSYVPGTHTGTFTCTLTTKSPLYVRGVMTVQDFAKYGETGIGDLDDELQRLTQREPSPEINGRIAELERIIGERAKFFALRDELPVIPGSSLRGMLRALIEIVSFGKVQDVTTVPLTFRAVGDTSPLGNFYREQVMHFDGEKPALVNGETKPAKHYTPLMQAGFMRAEGNDWKIQPAPEAVKGTTFARIACRIPPPNEKSKAKEPEEQRYPFVELVNQVDEPTRAILYTSPGEHEELKVYAGTRNAFEIWVEAQAYAYQPVKGGSLQIKYAPVIAARASEPTTQDFIHAVVAFSGAMDKKRHEAVIFLPEPAPGTLEIDERLAMAYRDQISAEQKKLLGDDGVLREGQPVFYRAEDNAVKYFGHTMMMRLSYGRSPLDFTPRELRRADVIDLAEALFGFAPSGERNTGRAGRLFVSDAKYDSNVDGIWLSEEHFAPRVLAAPKPTTFQHYLTQQQPDDVVIGCKKNGDEKYQARLDHYGSPTPSRAVIRGHKLYWHRDAVSLTQLKANEDDVKAKPKQYTRVRPVKSKVTFKFDIHFENLTDVELGALLWVLRLSKHKHHPTLGMGKPFGMGVVDIHVELVARKRASRYASLLDEQLQWALGEQEPLNEQTLIEKFEAYVLEHMDADERGEAKHLAELERIKVLYKLLEWPGPKPAEELARNMEIEPGARKENEFRYRPVLPDPFNLLPKFLEQTGTASPPRPRSSDRNSKKNNRETAKPVQGTGNFRAGMFLGLVTNKKFGFIRPDDGSKDVFVHENDLKGLNLVPNTPVRFHVEQGEKGPRAAQVEVLPDDLKPKSVEPASQPHDESRTDTAPAEPKRVLSTQLQQPTIDIGKVFKGKVRAIEDDGVVLVEIHGLDYDNTWGMIEPENLRGKTYREGYDVRCRVLEITQVEGHAVYICEVAPREKS